MIFNGTKALQCVFLHVREEDGGRKAEQENTKETEKEKEEEEEGEKRTSERNMETASSARHSLEV